MLCFEKQGGTSVIDPNTYLYYIQARPSNSRENRWIPYDEALEETLVGDFRRLWATSFLDDLAVDVRDVRYSNGVLGKLAIFNMEERQRVKIVDYVGSERVSHSDIDEKLKEKGITIRLDSFIDPGTVRQVAGVVRELYAEKGYQYAQVKPEIKEVAGGPKTIHLSFNITEGPKVRIDDIEFLGNQAVSDSTLGRKMKENKGRGFFGFITGGGTFKEDKFAEDADKVVEYYRDEGYITARVGQPELKILEDSEDGSSRFVQLRVPVTEGKRYKVGNFTFEGNTIVKGESLRPLFKLNTGDTYSEKHIRKGLEKAREIYGAGGYYEFTAYPDLQPRDMPPMPGNGDDAAGPSPKDAEPTGPPIVDVTMRVNEGKQYFVNRITFVGNTTTRDNVIRREMNLVEAAPFNTEALKFSIKRLNQLGYFKALEGDAIQVEKTADADNKVDVTLKFEEQNRNQLTLRRGRLAVRRILRATLVPDVELPRPRRNVHRVGAGGQPRAELPGRVHRAVPVRPADDARRRICSSARFGGPASSRRRPWRQPRLRVPDRQLLADVRNLQPRADGRQGSQRHLHRPAGAGRNPFLRDSLLIGQGGRRTYQQDRPELGVQHGRSADLSDDRHPIHAVVRLRGDRRRHEFRQPACGRYLVHPAQPPDVARLPRAG